ncbi:MAG: RraA family protein [Planctomycetales bacterium]|nr:RraA family protein [Planctomycetales bacterium]
MNAETLAQLAKFDTPTICNVIELLEIRPQNVGYMNSAIRCAFPDFSPMVGFAATAQFRSDTPPASGSGYGGMSEQLELFERLPGPAVVVFQDVDDPPVGATFGEVMCSTYQAFGSVGLITSGAGRDLEQVRALGYPVFTNSTICSHGYNRILHIGEPVRVGGLMVSTGDLLHGDANGVTNIPVDMASEIAQIAAEFVALENIVMDYVKGSGAKTRPGCDQARGQFQSELKKLRARVTRKR